MTWTILPRAADLTRDADPLSQWTELILVERYPLPDTWTITGPARVMRVFTPGSGCLLIADGKLVTSGTRWQRRRWLDTNGQLMWRVSFVEDTFDRIVYPDATHALTAAPTLFPHAYDTRVALPIEDLITDYVRWNAGDLALPARRVPDLFVPPSQHRGPLATVNARFDSLDTLVQDLAEAGRLRVKVIHDESTGTPRRTLQIDEVPDVSADVRFGINTGTGILTSFDATDESPKLTHAQVAGPGELAGRAALEVADPAAAAVWGRAEGYVDARLARTDDDTPDPAAMTAAGTKALAAGSAPAAVMIGVADGPDTAYRREYGPGYIVGIDLPDDDPTSDVVREATTTVAVEDGSQTEAVQIVVGTPGATADATLTDRLVDGALRAIDVLERSK